MTIKTEQQDQGILQILLDLWEVWRCRKAVPGTGYLLSKEPFPEFPLEQLHSTFLCPAAGHQGEEISTSSSLPPQWGRCTLLSSPPLSLLSSKLNKPIDLRYSSLVLETSTFYHLDHSSGHTLIIWNPSSIKTPKIADSIWDPQQCSIEWDHVWTSWIFIVCVILHGIFSES